MKMGLRMLVIAFAAVVLSAGHGMYSALHAETVLSGKVAETMDSSDYTYVLLEKDGDKTWVAVPQMHVVKGQTITFRPGIEMTDFHSKGLNRTFKKIFFSDGPAN